VPFRAESQGRAGHPFDSVQRCPSSPMLPKHPPRGSPRNAPAGRGGCPSPLPFGPIPPRRRRRRRQRLDCRSLGGHANPRRARGRVSLQPPSLTTCLPLRCGACAPLRLSSTVDSARVANDPHHALEATGCHGVPSPFGPRLHEDRHATPKCQWTDDDVGSSSEEPAPNRNTHGDTTRFAPHLCSPQRPESSALPPTVTRCDRWMETTFEEACRPYSARRREASCRDVRPDTVQRTRSARPRPKTRHARRSSTDHRLDYRSGARSQLTLSSCPKVLPPPRGPRSESLANSLSTRDHDQLERPEGHLRQPRPRAKS
jgi:hypothetical protein